MLLLIALVAVIVALLWFSYNGRDPTERRRGLFKPLDLQQFKRDCGGEVIRIERFFTHDGTPSLYAVNRNVCTINDWFNNTTSTEGCLSKLKFTHSTDNVIGKYFNRWIAGNIELFPKSLQSRIRSGEPYERSIKITNGKWRYPKPFRR